MWHKVGRNNWTIHGSTFMTSYCTYSPLLLCALHFFIIGGGDVKLFLRKVDDCILSVQKPLKEGHLSGASKSNECLHK